MATLREKYFSNMKRRDGSYIPFDFWLCPSQDEEFIKRLGKHNWAEYYEFPCRNVGANCLISEKEKKNRFLKYYKHIDIENVCIDDWGVGYKKGSIAHFTEMIHPMQFFASAEEFFSYPYPDPENDYSWTHLENDVMKIKAQDLIVVAGLATTVFEISWYLRGMDNLMIDMTEDSELAAYLMDRVADIRCKFAKKYAQSGVDVLFLGDDVSTQLDMMMSPEMWRRHLKPRMKKVIDAAKQEKPDMLIAYHGDGNLQKIIPDLIEVGVDILNPIQPECMDPVDIKKKYGDKLSFWGTVGTQTTLPFGTPDEVRAWCEKMIYEVGCNGGLMMAPTHVIEPEVPYDNIQAFIQTVREHNAKSS